jgi:hypothetical protein
MSLSLKGVKTPFRPSSVDSGVVAAYIVALDSGTVWLCFSVRSADSGSVPSDCSVFV